MMLKPNDLALGRRVIVSEQIGSPDYIADLPVIPVGTVGVIFAINRARTDTETQWLCQVRFDEPIAYLEESHNTIDVWHDHDAQAAPDCVISQFSLA